MTDSPTNHTPTDTEATTNVASQSPLGDDPKSRTDSLRPDGGQSEVEPGEGPGVTTAESPDAPESEAHSVAEETSRDLTTTLEWAGVLILGPLAVIATFRFYNSASRAIGRLVAPEYEPLFQAGFNLVILLLAVAGISVLTRRLVLDG